MLRTIGESPLPFALLAIGTTALMVRAITNHTSKRGDAAFITDHDVPPQLQTNDRIKPARRFARGHGLLAAAGAGAACWALWRAARDQLSDADKIQPGQD
jgi:hypothetical protein